MESTNDNNALAKSLLARIMDSKVARSEIGNLDLTQNQKTVLKHLIAAENNDTTLSMTELSQLLEITKSATSQAVAKMERKGIVRRKWAIGDRRRIIVRLTPKGKAIADTFFAEIVAFMEGCLSKLNEDEVKTLVTIFDKCIV